MPNFLISSQQDDNDEWTPNPNTKNILNSCNLSFHDYTVGNLWVGTGKPICYNPETLREEIGTRPVDLGVKRFEITTFDLANHVFYPNDSSLTWSPTYYGYFEGMLTLSMPENLIKLGIFQISIIIPNPPIRNLSVFVHQKGLLFTETPDAWQEIEVSGEGLSLPIVHEIEDLLSFDEEQCEDSKDYIYDQCKLSNIRKVSTLDHVGLEFKTSMPCLTFIQFSTIFPNIIIESNLSNFY